MTQDAALIIRVNLKNEASMFYADSPDLLGLHICGPTAEQTCETVIKAVKALFKHNRGLNVNVIPVTTDTASFPKLAGPCGQFVVQRMAA